MSRKATSTGCKSADRASPKYFPSNESNPNSSNLTKTLYTFFYTVASSCRRTSFAQIPRHHWVTCSHHPEVNCWCTQKIRVRHYPLNPHLRHHFRGKSNLRYRLKPSLNRKRMRPGSAGKLEFQQNLRPDFQHDPLRSARWLQVPFWLPSLKMITSCILALNWTLSYRGIPTTNEFKQLFNEVNIMKKLITVLANFCHMNDCF